MKTRSRKVPANVEATLNPVRTLDDQSQDPHKLLILPNETSPEARICTLSHPRTSAPCRYYFCPKKGIYEFTKIAAPKAARQSWLLQQHKAHPPSPDTITLSHQDQSVELKKGSLKAEEALFSPASGGYVIKSPELLVATPLDPLFLVLPALCTKLGAKSSSSNALFLSADDILETLEETSRNFSEVTSHNQIRQLIESRMRVVCETVDAGDETMFRLSKEKLLTELIEKSKKLVQSGLPASMEDKFVSRALARPVAVLKRDASSTSTTAGAAENDSIVTESRSAESIDSQASTVSSSNSATSLATHVTIPDEPLSEGFNESTKLLKLRVVLTYIFSAYIPQPLVADLNAMLAATDSPIDFKSLNEELAMIAKMRSEALASRSMADFSRKRSMKDDEAADIRAEKKARKEEEEKRKKAGETRGVRDLKKVDTTGMKKMSDFFGKASATKKKK